MITQGNATENGRGKSGVRRLIQYRMRTLMAVTLVLGVLFGWMARDILRYRTQYASLEQLQPYARMIDTRAADKRWLRAVFDDAVCQDVIGLFFDGAEQVRDINDGVLKHLEPLRHLMHLALDGAPVDDDQLRHVAELDGLLTLQLSGTRVSDRGLKQLRGLKHLMRLHLSDTRVTGAGLDHLRSLRRLNHLELAGLEITDDDVSKLESLRELRYLDLRRTKVTGRGLNRLAKLPHLESLCVSPEAARDLDMCQFPKLRNAYMD